MGDTAAVGWWWEDEGRLVKDFHALSSLRIVLRLMADTMCEGRCCQLGICSGKCGRTGPTEG